MSPRIAGLIIVALLFGGALYGATRGQGDSGTPAPFLRDNVGGYVSACYVVRVMPRDPAQPVSTTSVRLSTRETITLDGSEGDAYAVTQTVTEDRHICQEISLREDQIQELSLVTLREDQIHELADLIRAP